MARVCRPAGRIVLADMAPAADKAKALDAMERPRDPSHARLLPPAESIDGDPLDTALRREGERIAFAWPVAIVTATAAPTRRWLSAPGSELISISARPRSSAQPP